MQLKTRIEQDLKIALLSGNKLQITTLRGLKSAILYAEVAEGVRDKGLEEAKLIAVISKESKKRQESADIYQKAGESERASQELAEKKFIDVYLPAQLSEDQINEIIDAAIAEIGDNSKQAMGQIIGLVKQKTTGSADGSVIARLVKGKLA